MAIAFRPPLPRAARQKSAPRSGATMSIRARLVLLVLLVAVPLAADRLRLIETHRAERITTLSEEALALTRRGVDAQQEIVSTVRSVVQVVARARTAFASSEETCGQFLAGATADAPL